MEQKNKFKSTVQEIRKETRNMKILYNPLTMKDSMEFYHLAGDKRVAATMRFDCPRNRNESDGILSEYISAGNHTFALRFKPTESLFGVFAFKKGSKSGIADLSQMLLPEQWGHGLGNQIVKDMVSLARKEKWYKALEGCVLESNTASRRMAEKNGFHEKERHFLPEMKEKLVTYRIDL